MRFPLPSHTIAIEQMIKKKIPIDRVEWPGKENQAAQPKGYVYIIFESEKQVRELLNACTIQDGNDANAGNYYYKISSKRIKAKEVRRNRLDLDVGIFRIKNLKNSIVQLYS